MADVIIKGMEMPTSCWACACYHHKVDVGYYDYEICRASGTVFNDGYSSATGHKDHIDPFQQRLDNCPLRPAPEWISAEERLPKEKHAVLVWNPQYLNSYVAVLSEGEWFVFGGFGTKVFGVTHWMPLPEPPVGGDGGG